jgi:hypothetical protein
MKVVEFTIEESKVNKGAKVLIAHAENGERFVVAGNHWTPEFVEPYDQCFNTKDKS